MPLRNGTCGPLDELPEIPFLEDAALYYCNPEDELSLHPEPERLPLPPLAWARL